jgi:tripartite-type tricarboxylate transporter receptor subunit TctC
MRPWHKCVIGLGVAGLLAIAAPAKASTDFPSQNVTIVVPYTAGGPFDGVTRVFSERLREKLGRAVIVSARPGGNTIIATQSVKQAKADGHTLLIQSSSLFTQPLLIKNTGYSSSDFVPIAPLGIFPYMLFVGETVPAKNVAELIAHAKANPGRMNIGTMAPGGAVQNVSTRWLSAAEIDVAEIAYKGGADMSTALLSGDIQMMFAAFSAARPFVENGKMKTIAIAADERSPLLPNVPTFKELGLPKVMGQTWLVLFARADTPPDIIEKIRKASYEIILDTEYDRIISQGGIGAWKIAPDKLGSYIAGEAKEWEEEIRKMNLTPQ